MSPRSSTAPEPTAAHRGGSGTPLLLLHGFAASWRAWLPVLPRLEDEHSVFAPTLPGHFGGTDLPEGVSPTVDAIADGLEALLDADGIDRAHIAGNSMGGWLALELARRGRARSVIALSPGGAWTSDARMALTLAEMRIALRVMRALQGRVDWLIRRPRGRKLFLSQMAEHGDRVEAAEVSAFMREMVKCPTFEPLIASLLDKQLEPVPNGADCPIRIAWGDFDRVIPHRRFGPPMRERVPGADFQILPGVGHVPMPDDPELVARTILQVTRAADAAARQPTSHGT